MDLISIFALIILIISIGTLLVGVAAYAAFKIRQARGPLPVVHGHEHPVTELMFLKPYFPAPADPKAKSPVSALNESDRSATSSPLSNS